MTLTTEETRVFFSFYRNSNSNYDKHRLGISTFNLPKFGIPIERKNLKIKKK